MRRDKSGPEFPETREAAPQGALPPAPHADQGPQDGSCGSRTSPGSVLSAEAALPQLELL